jgi:DNA-binding winged helix-turn-helix (wHTH) protein
MAVYRFLGFDLDTRTGELRRQQDLVRLRPQPSAVLACLVERHGRFVSRQELHRVVWPDGTFVRFEDGLNSCMKQVRAALGDSRTAPRFIETLTRRGYRFIAPVVAVANDRLCPGMSRARIRLLPVRDLDTPGHGPLADGLGEELLAQLATAAPADLAVVGDWRAAAEPGGSPDVAADYVLATSVRGAGSRVRATAQLIETRSQQHVWAGRVDRSLDHALDTQAAVAEQIVAGVVSAIRDAGDEDFHDSVHAGIGSRAQ